MSPRQARRERREAERKAKKLDLKKGRLAENHPLAVPDEFHEIQPRWNPEPAGQPSCGWSTLKTRSAALAKPQHSALPGSDLEDEFPREVQIRNNAMMDRRSLQAGLPIPPPGPARDPSSSVSIKAVRQHYLGQRSAAAKAQPASQTEVLGFVSQNMKRAATNRANSQHSTGPRSSTGKLASSRNSMKHGLASGQVIIPGEDAAAFESLLNDLLEEHQPATPTEELLLHEMAQSHWLAQRAIRLQNLCFTAEGVNEKQLALLLRYQTTYQRAFHKALNTLLKLKKLGSVSQRRSAAQAEAGFVSQTTPETIDLTRFPPQNAPQAHQDITRVRPARYSE